MVFVTCSLFMSVSIGWGIFLIYVYVSAYVMFDLTGTCGCRLPEEPGEHDYYEL